MISFLEKLKVAFILQRERSEDWIFSSDFSQLLIGLLKKSHSKYSLLWLEF